MAIDHLEPLHSPHKWLEKAIAEQYPLIGDESNAVDPEKGKNRHSSVDLEREQNSKYRQAIADLIAKLQIIEVPSFAVNPVENELLEILAEIGSGDAPIEMIHLQEKLDNLNHKFLDQAWNSLDTKTQSEIHESAENSIGTRRTRLSAEMLKSEIERLRLYEMQVRYELPRLSLFDLQGLY